MSLSKGKIQNSLKVNNKSWFKKYQNLEKNPKLILSQK